MGPAGPWKNFATWRRSGNAATLTLFRSDPMNFIIYEPPLLPSREGKISPFPTN